MGDEASTLSFNEVASLATKAARASGLGWGLAEDIGHAARWLAEQDFAWDAALCLLLRAADVAVRSERVVSAADWACRAVPGEQLTIDDAGDAIWVLAAVSVAVYGHSHGIAAHGTGVDVRLTSNGGMASTDDAWRSAGLAGPLTLTATADGSVQAQTRRKRPGPTSLTSMATLHALADRILVPVSERSRARGAGAGRSDND